MKHTPGPWEMKTLKTQCGICHTIGDFQSSRRQRPTYACVYDDGSDLGHPEPTLLANARLMAAAPELLELLKWAVEHSDECLGDHSSRLQAAENIIAKAEGK